MRRVNAHRGFSKLDDPASLPRTDPGPDPVGHRPLETGAALDPHLRPAAALLRGDDGALPRGAGDPGSIQLTAFALHVGSQKSRDRSSSRLSFKYGDVFRDTSKTHMSGKKG